MQIRNLLAIIFILFFITSCIDEYWPEVDKYENLLVVDGQLTNSSEDVFVKLSISSSLSNYTLIPINGADVFFTDEDQSMTHLTETESGIYLPSDSTFHGKIGEVYQLHINLPNGKSYISDECQVPFPSPIDSLYGIIDPNNSLNKNSDFPGIQFYVENHSDINDTSYFIWKSYETYKYRSSFDIDFTWEGELIPNPDVTALRTCWKTSKVNDFIVSSTELTESDYVNKFPLHFVSTETKKLSIRYSLLVKQLSVSKTTFNFYEAIQEQNEEQGQMWSKQPMQILGNIHNIDNPDEPVLGYFITAGIDQKRIFVDRPQLQFYYTECTPDFEVMRFIQYEPPSSWPIYIEDIMYLGLVGGNSKECFDCRLSGGNLTPPDFWE